MVGASRSSRKGPGSSVDGSADTITDGRKVTRELAEWVADLRSDAIPDEVLNEAGRSFADFLGECLFVGATKPWGQSIASFCAHDGGGQPEATIIATGQRTLASRAALANGTMALGFEFADFGSGSRPYPFAVTAPLALAESRHHSGEDLALAIVVGYEVMGRVFDATFTRGTPIPFYVPSVYGTIAGAAGAARLLGLPADETNRALGLACAFTGGTFQGHEEGTWQRSLNGGMAGERAVTAALLAQSGFRATELGLEGSQGFAQMFTGGRLEPGALLDGLGDSWFISSRWVKRYPMNTTLHAPVEALLQVMRENDLHYKDIIEIDAAWQQVEPFLAKRQVSTVVSAQASLPFALAVAAVRGTSGRRRVHRGGRRRSDRPGADHSHGRASGRRTPPQGDGFHAGSGDRKDDGRAATYRRGAVSQGQSTQPDERRGVQGQVRGHGRARPRLRPGR